MQSVAEGIWRRGRRHGANAVVAAVGADRAHRELGTETEVVAFVAVVVGGEHASVQREERGRGGEVAPRKGWRLPRRDTSSPSKGVEVAHSAHVLMETATSSGTRSGKPSIAAVRMVVEGRGHVRTR